MTSALISPSFKNIAAGLAGLLLASACFFAATPQAHASVPPCDNCAYANGLTENQVSALLNLLSAFGADQSTIDNVSNILNGSQTPSSGLSATVDSVSTNSLRPTITGTISGSFSVYLAIGDSHGDSAYTSDAFFSNTNNWSYTLNRDLSPGYYKVVVVGPGYQALATEYFTVGPSEKTGPTASLTQNGTTTQVVASVGDPIRFKWSSTGAAYASSYFTVDSNDTCGNKGNGYHNPWIASSTQGSQTSTVYSCQAGHTYRIYYTVTASDGKTSSASVTSRILADDGVSLAVPASGSAGPSLMVAAATVPLSLSVNSINMLADQITEVNYAIAGVLSSYVALFSPDTPQAAAAASVPAPAGRVAGESLTATLAYLPQSLYETVGKTTDFLASVEMAPVHVISDALSGVLFKAGLY